MKKIFLALALILGLSLTASAQSMKPAPKNDIEELASLVNINPQLKADFYTIVSIRQDAFAKAATADEKKTMFNRYTTKMLSALTPEQKELLNKNQDLYKRLTTYSED